MTALSLPGTADASVADPPRLSDAEIRDRIRDELHSSRLVDPDDVTVAVHDGTAILTGRVDNWSELAAATESAWRGATWVVNDLELPAEGSGQDSE